MFDLLTGITGLEPEKNKDMEVLALARDLLVDGQKSRQRRTLVFAGEPNWCRHYASDISKLPELQRVLLVADEEMTGEDFAEAEVVSASSAKRLIGQECDVVVFDAYCGFDPDAFGAICGTIRAGGLLILCCPSLSEWDHVADPASERIAISPLSYKDISGRFLRRLITVIRDANGVTIFEQNKPLPSIMSHGSETTTEQSTDENLSGDFRTEDQKIAVEAIENAAYDHQHRPTVLISDRGRGKSAALGIAAAHLLIKKLMNSHSVKADSKDPMRIVVTAPRPNAVESLFSHAQQVLQQVFPESKYSENRIQVEQSQIQYLAPDVLYSLQEPVDLVLVDEAAAIPTSMLTRFLKKYSRIAFATTVHGYEGTGRGFSIRFRETLDTETPGWKEVKLQTPIRWAVNDPLEQLVFKALLLNAEISDNNNVLDVDTDNVTIERIDRDKLVNDEHTLSQIFGLLVVAHYRTTPNDLRNLLDGPGIAVYAMRANSSANEHKNSQIVATALVSTEGEFSSELANEIFTGKRRPRGHLIPQSLVTHVGIKQAAFLRCARIMRIAVHPALQRKTLGSKLVQAIRNDVISKDYDVMGVSFGATKELIRFWKAQEMQPVRVGFRRDHASGEHSVMMLWPLNQKGDEVYQLARARLVSDLPYWLSDSLREMESGLAEECLQNKKTEKQVDLNQIDRKTVIAFANGERSYEDASAALWRFTEKNLVKYENLLEEVEINLLRSKVLQRHTWIEVAELCKLSGRSAVINGLRSAVLNLLKSER